MLNGFKYGRMELKVLVSESTMKLFKTFHKHRHKDVFDFVNNTHSNAVEICGAFWKCRGNGNLCAPVHNSINSNKNIFS